MASTILDTPRVIARMPLPLPCDNTTLIAIAHLQKMAFNLPGPVSSVISRLADLIHRVLQYDIVDDEKIKYHMDSLECERQLSMRRDVDANKGTSVVFYELSAAVANMIGILMERQKLRSGASTTDDAPLEEEDQETGSDETIELDEQGIVVITLDDGPCSSKEVTPDGETEVSDEQRTILRKTPSSEESLQLQREHSVFMQESIGEPTSQPSNRRKGRTIDTSMSENFVKRLAARQAQKRANPVTEAPRRDEPSTIQTPARRSQTPAVSMITPTSTPAVTVQKSLQHQPIAGHDGASTIRIMDLLQAAVDSQANSLVDQSHSTMSSPPTSAQSSRSRASNSSDVVQPIDRVLGDASDAHQEEVEDAPTSSNATPSKRPRTTPRYDEEMFDATANVVVCARPKEKTFKCDCCERAFTTQTGLTNHRKVHTGVKCRFCKHHLDADKLAAHISRLHGSELAARATPEYYTLSDEEEDEEDGNDDRAAVGTPQLYTVSDGEEDEERARPEASVAEVCRALGIVDEEPWIS